MMGVPRIGRSRSRTGYSVAVGVEAPADLTRPIPAAELVLPLQSVIVVLAGDVAARSRIADELADTVQLVEQRRAERGGRLVVLYRPVVAVTGEALRASINARIAGARAAGATVELAELRTLNLAAVPGMALEQAFDLALDVVTFIPRQAAAAVARGLSGGVGFGVIVGAVAAIAVGVGIAYLVKK